MGNKIVKDLSKVFRISIVDDASHKHIMAWRITKLRIVISIISAIVVVFTLFYCIMAFTPLRTTIPGYPDAHSKRIAVENAIKIDSLESIITRWNIYADNLSRVLSGEQTISIDSIIHGSGTRYLSDKTTAELARQDSLLRESVSKSEQFELGEKGRKEMALDGMHFFSPVKGVVAEKFVPGLHLGIDISAPAGSIVSATMDGTVICTGWVDTEGYMIEIQHPGNLVSLYKNCENIMVKASDKVSAGTPLAVVGTNRSVDKGNHLHFELWYKGEAINPTKYVNF